MTYEAFLDLASRAAIHRILRQMHAAMVIEPVDEIRLKGTGRTAIVWALPQYRPRRNQTRHDLIVSQVILALGLPARRGGAVEKGLEPDIEWPLPNGEIIRGEVDTGSVTYREVVEERYVKYRESEDVVLWISCGLWGSGDKVRLQALRAHAASIAKQAWFVTLQEITTKKGNAELVNHAEELLTFAELWQQVMESETNGETNPAP